MAVYKVPQDVEADDKLLGPFSFRQFIYLVAAVLGIGMAWGLGVLFIPLAVIPLPIVLFFGALALPLKKDQPMEVYLAAVVSFYIKPRKRMWQPDGLSSLVEVTAPKVIEIQRTKDISQDEAQRRLSYLANIVDTGGWAVRGAGADGTGTAMNTDAYIEAQQTTDIMDEAASITQNFDTMIEKHDQKRRQEIMDRMSGVPEDPTPQPQPAPIQQDQIDISYNPYPTNIRQSVIQPLSDQPQPEPVPILTEPVPVPAPTQQTPEQPYQPNYTEQAQPQPVPTPQPAQQQPVEQVESTSETPVSPDIINLANQHDLSIQTIAHEANRIREREQNNEEVVISLR